MWGFFFWLCSRNGVEILNTMLSCSGLHWDQFVMWQVVLFFSPPWPQTTSWLCTWESVDWAYLENKRSSEACSIACILSLLSSMWHPKSNRGDTGTWWHKSQTCSWDRGKGGEMKTCWEMRRCSPHPGSVPRAHQPQVPWVVSITEPSLTLVFAVENVQSEGWRHGQRLRASGTLAETWVWFPTPRLLTTAGSTSSRGPTAPPLASRAQTHTHIT